MWLGRLKWKSLFAIFAAIGVAAAVACSSAESEEPSAPAPSAAPVASATSASPQAPAAPAYHSGYVARKVTPGGYPTYEWDGPMPTSFRESPESAELVRQGKILPLEQRLPVPEDVVVVPPDDEIGVYGGAMRLVSSSDHGRLTSFARSGCFFQDADGVKRVVAVCKDMSLSEDGRVYTFKLRRGARWSDGYPLTMEDFRFAWEDLNLNREFMGNLPLLFMDPITGNPPKFEVVDDLTWTLTFASPNRTIIESKSGAIFSGPRSCNQGHACFFAPSHVFKRYHPRYTSSGDLKQLVEFHRKNHWTDLFYKMYSAREWLGTPSKPIPTEYDPNYVYVGKHYMPWTGGMINTEISDQVHKLGRNHYSMFVDPDGNQLPYLDASYTFLVESREVGVFRSMAGETDFGGADMILSEFPLYLANMEKGDYSIPIYRSAAGGDTTIKLNQEYNEDSEIGRLLRARDFRVALSLGWNRAGTNETVFAGLGTPQNWTPHPTTVYYPGQEWATLDIEYDPDRASKLLDALGLMDTDGDGIRNRADGRGNLELYLEVYERLFPIAQLLQRDWGEIGIQVNIREGARSFKAVERNKQYFVIGGSLYGVNPWAVAWTRLVPLTIGHPLGPGIGEYYETGGREGMSPSGPDENYLPLAPEGTYPADSSGNLRKLQEIWTEGRVHPQFSPERIELGKELFRIVAMEKYHINGVSFTGLDRGIHLKRNNFRNTPKNHFPTQLGGYPETWYFEDGIDNYNHPGNKSKKYESISFVDPEYWD